MTRSIKDEAELIADNIECATQRRWVSEDERSTAVLNIKAGLERQLAAKDAEVKRLREDVVTLRSACEAVRDAGNVSWGIDDEALEDEDCLDDDERFMEAIEVAGKKCLAALAATSRGEGETG